MVIAGWRQFKLVDHGISPSRTTQIHPFALKQCFNVFLVNALAPKDEAEGLES